MNIFYPGIKALVPLTEKWLNVSNHQVEIRRAPSATHMPRIQQSQNKVLGITAYVILFF
jgi:hypothetical protein